MELLFALIRELEATGAVVLVVLFASAGFVAANYIWAKQSRYAAETARKEKQFEHERKMYELQTERGVRENNPVAANAKGKVIEHRRSEEHGHG